MRRIIGVLFLTFASLLHGAVATQCVVCQRPIKERLYFFSSPYLPEKQSVCGECAQLETTCSVCSVPIRTQCIKLGDGRLICERDAKECVLTDDLLQEIFADVKR